MNPVKPEDWWRVTPQADGITLIDEPHIKPFYRCNCWHVRGRDRNLLVDSGMGVVSLRDWVPLVTEKATTAVASHTHFDHIGCHHEFSDRLIHPAEAHLLAAPTRENTYAEYYVTDEIFERLPPDPYDSASYAVPAAPPTSFIEDGDVISTGDREFEVIHTPGHSPGGIALWEAATETLIAGDIVYDGPLVDDVSEAEMQDYIRSMRRLRDLSARIVHGGHFPSFSGDRLREIIDAWLRSKAA